MVLKNSKIFEIFRASQNVNDFEIALLEEMGVLLENASNDLKAKIKYTHRNIKRKWYGSSRNMSNFIKKNENWLEEYTTFGDSEEEVYPSTSRGRGRPHKNIQECSAFTRKRKLEDATESITTEHLSEALSLRYVKEQNKPKATITKAVQIASPLRLTRIKESIPAPPNSIAVKYTNEEAFCLFMDLGLTKEKYAILRSSLKKHNVDVMPGYKKIASAKKEAVPPNTIITEISAELKLQDLMDHTARRLLESLPDGEVELLPENLTLLNKWGCDGSSGQSAYKQIINTDDETISDENMFMASVVILRLRSETSEHWRNLRPSSIHYCRPIFFKYAKESSELTKSTVSDIKNQISQLKPTVFQSKTGKTFTVKFDFFLTMIDGKVLNEITNTSSTLRCPICKKNSKRL